MKTISIQDAEGVELDYLVCMALDFNVMKDAMCGGYVYSGWWVSGFDKNNRNNWTQLKHLRFHESIHLLWPVIESFDIDSTINRDYGKTGYNSMLARMLQKPHEEGLWYAAATGSTRLQGAARCFVKSQLGECAQIPENLA